MTGNITYRDVVTRAALTMMTWPYTSTNSGPIHEIIGMQTALPLVADGAKRCRCSRASSRSPLTCAGCKTRMAVGARAPRITTRMRWPQPRLLYALSLLSPTSVDPALIAAAHYLLQDQAASGYSPRLRE